MSRDRQIYLLDPQKLPPETIAVTFAKTSRSPDSFRNIAAELTAEKSADFHEKWVVGYGHSSVAEHAVLHIAVENISRLAVECLESNRLASYTEKSTRYQTWDNEAFYRPKEWMGSEFEAEYLGICSSLFDAYAKFLPLLQTKSADLNPPIPGETASAYERRVRSYAVDVCRFLLPAASLANVGVTINARALEHAIGKMLSSPLAEVREVGAEIKSAALESIPTLLKYANAIPYLQQAEQAFQSTTNEASHPSSWCDLVLWDTDAVNQFLASTFYRYSLDSNLDFATSLKRANRLNPEQKEMLLKELLCNRDAHTIPLRELEHISFTFDAYLDQGAYYEVKRHRMMTLTPQPLTCSIGYAIPSLVSAAGLEEEYRHQMRNAISMYQRLARVNPHSAAYIVPNAFNRRFLITCNLRSLMHFIALRSAANAHFSIRRLAQKMSEEITRILPQLGSCIPRLESETSSSIEANYFSKTEEEL